MAPALLTWLIVGSGLFVVCLVSLGLALIRRQRFLRELAATRAGQYPAQVAYQRFMTDRIFYTTLTLRQGAPPVFLGLILLPVTLLQLAALALAPTSYSIDQQLLHALPTVILLLPIEIVAPIVLYSLLTAVIADAPALAQLRGLATRPRDVAVYRLKAELLSRVSIAAVFEVCAVLYALGVAPLLCALIAVWAITTLLVVLRALSAAYQFWFVPTRPLEQTQWAHLAPRIREWSRLANAPLGGTFVSFVSAYGGGGGGITGARRMLFLSDSFLSNSDWRQQDAFVCLLLSANKARARSRLDPFSAFLLLLFIGAACAIAYKELLAGTIESLPPPTLALIALVLCVVALVALSVRARQANERLKRFLVIADQRAAELTGDPYAVATMLNTVSRLSGLDPQTRLGITPSTAERMRAVIKLVWQPGPRALWAYEPVPSIAPVQIGGLEITVPLDPQRIPPPAPVPAQPYPVVAPAVYPQMAPVAPPQPSVGG